MTKVVDVSKIPTDQVLDVTKPVVWGGNQNYTAKYLARSYDDQDFYSFLCVDSSDNDSFVIEVNRLGFPRKSSRYSICRIVNVPEEPEDTVVLFRETDGHWKIYNSIPWTENQADEFMKFYTTIKSPLVKLKVPVKG